MSETDRYRSFRQARCEVRFDPKTDLILTPNPVATCLLRKLHYR